MVPGAALLRLGVFAPAKNGPMLALLHNKGAVCHQSGDAKALQFRGQVEGPGRGGTSKLKAQSYQQDQARVYGSRCSDLLGRAGLRSQIPSSSEPSRVPNYGRSSETPSRRRSLLLEDMALRARPVRKDVDERWEGQEAREELRGTR